jgi:hypothetical protein
MQIRKLIQRRLRSGDVQAAVAVNVGEQGSATTSSGVQTPAAEAGKAPERAGADPA